MRKVSDLVGRKFGMLTVLKMDDTKKYHWICECECNSIKSVLRCNLVTGDTKSCGCLKVVDLTGVRFERLLAIRLDSLRNSDPDVVKNGTSFWICKCDCGRSVSVSRSNLKFGKTRSCGCLREDLNKQRRIETLRKLQERSQKRLEDQNSRLERQSLKKQQVKPKGRPPVVTKIEIDCVNCRSTFLVYPNMVGVRKYCSWKCRQYHMRGENAPSTGPREWMRGEKNPNWKDGRSKERALFRESMYGFVKSWRLRVLYRDSYTCQSCGLKPSRKGQLNAHHIAPWSIYPNSRYEVSNGITLCKQCHKKVHKHVSIENMDAQGNYLSQWLQNRNTKVCEIVSPVPTLLVAEEGTQKELLQQAIAPSGQSKATQELAPFIERDSLMSDSLNLISQTSQMNSLLGCQSQTYIFLDRLVQIFPWLEKEQDLLEFAANCFLKDSDKFDFSSPEYVFGKMSVASSAQTKQLPSRKSSKRLQVWGIAAPGNLGMVKDTSPKTENGFSSWAITADVRATEPKPTKKSLQEIFEAAAIPVKVYVDGVEEAQESPTFCGGGWQHRSPLHRDKRGASFAALYRAAGGDRIYHDQAPCLRSPNNSGTGAYKIREYQGETYLERPINATEAEQLMGWEVGSTAIGINKEGDEISISQTQRIKILGNGIIPGEIADILTAIKPMLERKLESEVPESMRFAYRQSRQKGMSHQEAIRCLT